MGRQGRRRKRLLDDLKEMRGYYKLKGEALDRTLWRTHVGRGYGAVVRETTEWMNLLPYLLDCWTMRSLCCWSEYVNILLSSQNVPAIRRSTILRAMWRPTNTSESYTWGHFCLVSKCKIPSAGLWHGTMAWGFQMTHPNGGPRTIRREPNRQWIWCSCV
jgi:hypothetical protein